MTSDLIECFEYLKIEQLRISLFLIGFKCDFDFTQHSKAFQLLGAVPFVLECAVLLPAIPDVTKYDELLEINNSSPSGPQGRAPASGVREQRAAASPP